MAVWGRLLKKVRFNEIAAPWAKNSNRAPGRRFNNEKYNVSLCIMGTTRTCESDIKRISTYYDGKRCWDIKTAISCRI